MKTPSVADLTPGQPLNGVFLVQGKEVRQKKTGEPFLSLVLMDRTGDVDAKMWDNVAEVMSTFDRDDFVRIKGETQLYNNRLQVTVHRLQTVSESEVDLADYLPASKRDANEMFAELRAAVSGMRNVHLRGLLNAILDDPKIAEAYRRAPAAKTIHHAYLGGLLEHVLSLLSLARLTAKHYPFIDEDLLLAGVVLHDIGKISELHYARSFGYSTEGQLLGHMQMATRIIAEKLPQVPEFPEKLRVLVEHLVLSHHGKLEYGSPKVPLFPEAMLLHHLDNLDSKMEAMRATLERDAALDSVWTGYNPALERPVLDLRKYLSEEQPKAPAAAKPAPNGGAKGKQNTLFGDALSSALGKES